HAVGGAHYLVVGPASSVGALPSAVLGDQLAPALGVERPAAQGPVRLQDRIPALRRGRPELPEPRRPSHPLASAAHARQANLEASKPSTGLRGAGRQPRWIDTAVILPDPGRW